VSIPFQIKEIYFSFSFSSVDDYKMIMVMMMMMASKNSLKNIDSIRLVACYFPIINSIKLKAAASINDSGARHEEINTIIITGIVVSL